jgi:divinyl chlorophyllide a 8-vinyl-reductase
MTGEKVTIVGATGYIGKAVVRESVRRGYATRAVVRDSSRASKEPKFSGADLVEADVCSPETLNGIFRRGDVDIVVSCLASRSGVKKDAYAIDYQATLNVMEVK